MGPNSLIQVLGRLRHVSVSVTVLGGISADDSDLCVLKGSVTPWDNVSVRDHIPHVADGQ